MDELTSAMLQQIHEIEDRDENQILGELAGDNIKEFIYETEVDEYYNENGQRKKHKVRKVKLSWVGTREAARLRGNIAADEPIVTETADEFRVVIRFKDLANNFSVFGGSHQPKKMRVNDWDPETRKVTGTHLEDDPYAFQKCLSKAQRNGLQSVIPADWTAKMIDRFLKAAGQLPPGQPQRYVPGPGGSGPVPRLATKTKPKAEWDKVTKDLVPTYDALERVIWDLSKLQPRDMYKELGGGSKNDMTISPWDAYQTLKSHFCPAEPPNA